MSQDSQYADRFGAEWRPMYMQTEHGAVFRGGPEEAAFMVCRCGSPVKVGMEAQHENEVAHASPPPVDAPTTTVTRGPAEQVSRTDKEG